MQRVAPSTRSPQRDAHRQPATPARGQWLTQAAFVLTAALVVCRLLISESIRSSIDPLAGGSPTPLAPGPGSGLVLDLLCCVPALLVLGRRAIDGGYTLLRSWSHLFMGLLGVWAALSPLWAADRFAATVSAAHLFASLVLLWSTSQLVRSWLRLRIVGGVCLGLLLALSAAGYYYRLVELHDMTQTWQEHKTEFLAEHGWKPNSFEALQFEKRILAGQPMGFSASTNTYAALLVLLGVVSTGLLIQRRADGDHAGWSIVPTMAILAAIPLIKWTQCRAAFATPVMAAMLLLAVALLRRHLARFARPAYVAGVLLVALGAAFMVRHGLRYGTLWHESLTFRWHYWVGSFRVFREHCVAGVGWENFGAYYLGRRMPVAAEEIRDPHNFIVRVFVELGTVGGVFLVAWMLSLWWGLTRPRVPITGGEALGSEPSPIYGRGFAMLTILLIAGVGVALCMLLGIDWNAAGEFVLLEGLRHAIFLVAVLTGLAAGALRSPPRPTAGARPGDIDFALDDRPAPWALHAILAGLATFLVHNLIEFSLFEPGPLLLFALLAGGALGVRLAGHEPDRVRADIAPGPSRLAVVGISAAGLAWLTALCALVFPVASAEGMTHDADDDARRAVALLAPGRGRDSEQGFALLSDAAKQMGDAFARLPMNADYAARAARLMIAARISQSNPAQVRAMLDAAVKADPSSVTNLTTRAQFAMSPDVQDPASARRDYERALNLDPNNVRLRLEYAHQLQALATKQGPGDLAGAAIKEYSRAAEMNAQLSDVEPKRLSATELADLRRAFSALETMRPTSSPRTNAPANPSRP
ncbi:MAG TPA: O-antigen ligase family protein [Tepidisphaeraceae bacterium]|jgi:O-antigen ligase|nr:O-antigen ligase family protein [Tepidisphaeraceae bacterium]